MGVGAKAVLTLQVSANRSHIPVNMKLGEEMSFSVSFVSRDDFLLDMIRAVTSDLKIFGISK